MTKDVSIIIVSYKTHALLKAAYESIRRFYPEIKVIIVDGSPIDTSCYKYAKSLRDANTKVYLLNKNIGHGPGMIMGIRHCTTKYFLLMDSDVEIQKPKVIERMKIHLELIEECQPKYIIYGIGQVMTVNETGVNSKEGMEYLHPHFALIKKQTYHKFRPIINHGAPMLSAMKSLRETGGRPFHFQVWKYIFHKERGTRSLNPKEFNHRNWDRV